VANKFLNIRFPGEEEEKISKSRGKALWISAYSQVFDPDPLRYYLTAIAPENTRTAFDLDDFVARNNGELLNALGNFINRTLTFAQRYHEAKVPEPGLREEIDLAHLELIAAQHGKVTDHIEAFRFKAALGEVMALARASNVYLDRKQPWKQRKEDLSACGTTINVCLQTVRALTTMMAPFLPFSAERCAEMLRLRERPLHWDEATAELAPGHDLGEPVILYRKLDAEALG
jgi:methionyl-tRNA synthetase